MHARNIPKQTTRLFQFYRRDFKVVNLELHDYVMSSREMSRIRTQSLAVLLDSKIEEESVFVVPRNGPKTRGKQKGQWKGLQNMPW